MKSSYKNEKIRRFGSIDEVAKEYALTNEQLLSYLLSNDIDAISDLDKIDLDNKNIKAVLNKINNNKKINNHNNLTSLKSIEIVGLFGRYNYRIDFNNDISIWVSENGIGKTTILNIIVAILTGDQKTLMDINFKKVIVNISKRSYEIDKEQYYQVNSNNINYNKKIEILLEELSMNMPRSYFIKLRNDLTRNKYIDLDFVEDLSYKFLSNGTDIINGKRIMYLLDELKELQYKDLSRTLYKIKEALEEDILFYPTYRRVEVGLDKIFLNRRKEYNRYDLSPKYMGFGMNDVKTRIGSLLDKMRKDANTAYLDMNANIISELLKKNVNHYLNKYNQIDMHKVDVIIKRIGEDRIENIDSLRSFLDDSSSGKSIPNIEFLLYYLQKLVKIYDSQKGLDSKLKKFSDVCTKYLSGKKIIYDETSLTMDVYDCDNEKIDFEDLSSGEKQVVSIFSKVYLDVITPCIFIIDEPEISLSIEWQKEFLKDIFNSGKIGLMIATTHSPFIFKNEYREFVIELDKFKEA